jgi:hypothetical protein
MKLLNTLGLRRSKRENIEVPKTLILKSNDAGFEYLEQYCAGVLDEGNCLFGQIVREFQNGERGRCKFEVKLATDRGTETVNCELTMDGFYGSKGIASPQLTIGDLVLVNAARYSPMANANSPMQFFGILAKAKLEVDIKTNELVLDDGS